MRKFIHVFLICLISVIFYAGCVQFPERVNFTCESCFQHAVCMYYSAKGDIKSDCSLEYSGCRKDTIYNDCKTKEKRWENQGCQDCYNVRD